jgi:hypothetical protein
MKNSNALSLVLCIGILIVIGCACPKEIQNEIDKAGKTTPSPTTGTTPSKTGSDDAELTMEKFNQIKNGMTYDECVEIMGSEGNQIVSAGEGKYKVESYKWEGDNFQYVMLSFMGGKLNSKAQNGLK